jgi:hypothetical protein
VRTTWLLLACLALSAPLYAQAATPASSLAWDQIGQSVTVAQSAGYTVFLDGAPTGTALASVTCTATGASATCSAPFPALTPGAHTLTLTQTISGASSAKSAPLSFTFVIVVTPTNLRVTP